MRFGWLGLLALAACSSATGPAQIGSEFSLRVGQATSIPDLNLFVRFVEVAGDSRCPTAVLCIWAGDAAVVIETGPAIVHANTDTLHTTLEPRAVEVGNGFLLRLVRLDPYPEETTAIPQGAYLVTLTTAAR